MTPVYEDSCTRCAEPFTALTTPRSTRFELVAMIG